LELVSSEELEGAWPPQLGEQASDIVVALGLTGKPSQHQLGEFTAIGIKATLL
jgi:hypothetical protein